MSVYRYTIRGAPRSGKNSQRIVRKPNGRRFTIKSKAATEWLEKAEAAIRNAPCPRRPMTGAFHVAVIIHQRSARPDGDNVQSLAWDALTRAGVISDDSAIVEWSGRKITGVAVGQQKVEIVVRALERKEAA